MNTASFSVAADVVSFTGPGGVDLKPQITGFTWVDSRTLRVDFARQTTQGTYTMVIGPQVLAADNGHAMDQDRRRHPRRGDAGPLHRDHDLLPRLHRLGDALSSRSTWCRVRPASSPSWTGSMTGPPP